MGYGVMVYAVDIDKLVALCGSGDDRTRRMISGRFRERVSQLNVDLDWSNERAQPSVFEAIRQLVMGDGLVFGGAPVPIPLPDDFPAIGHWTAEPRRVPDRS